jgi:type IV secretory pathway VirJ component
MPRHGWSEHNDVARAISSATLCPLLPQPDPRPGDLRVMKLPGGHHFDGDYRRLASLILGQLAAP